LYCFFRIFRNLIQNFIDWGRRGRDRGPDTLGHQLDLREVGRPGQATGARGCSRTAGVGGLESIVNPVAMFTIQLQQHFAVKQRLF
jgi:hypothetical protein